MSTKNSLHWADQTARAVVASRGKQKRYVCAAGITPSGTVHIGNFREMITVELVVRALRELGHEVRFIYSWDDYDVFRKVPANLPKLGMLQKHLRFPITLVPDPFGCHTSYAEHHEKEVEDVLPAVGIAPELLYQSKKYGSCEYADEIRFALKNKDKVSEILNTFRSEALGAEWLPLSVYCEKCHTDETTISEYDGEYAIEYSCNCGHVASLDFRKKGLVKLPWRMDWPMRWNYEKVDFEPGGKEHSTEGGSYSTAKLVVKELYGREAPFYQKYDFIIIKGKGGKMSSSVGDVITLKDALGVYEPEIIRHVFASTRPTAEFAISFDIDVLKVYEDYDRCERIYFKKDRVADKEWLKQKRIYELSQVEGVPNKMAFQPPLRHVLNVYQIYGGDEKKVVAYFAKELKTKQDKEKFLKRLRCAEHWLQEYAPSSFKFSVNSKADVKATSLAEGEKAALQDVAAYLAGKKRVDEKQLHEEFYTIAEKHGIEARDFFQAAYKVLIGKEKGPKLASFILVIGKEKVVSLFSLA